MNTIHKLYSEDMEKVDAVLYNGKLISAGQNRSFKTAVEFNNDADLNETIQSFADINCDSFSTTELSLSFWIHPKNNSFQNSPIFVNEDQDKLTGVFYNCGEEGEGNLGVCWNEDKNKQPTKFDVKISNSGWVHFIILFEKEGIVRVFGNGKYLFKHDMGRDLEKVKFSNMKLGGFSGWLDDFNVYHYPLKYGKVNLNQLATQNVSYLFNTSRKNGDLSIPVDIDFVEKNEPFHYLQNNKFVEAHKNYNLQKQNNQNYFDEESMYQIVGGENDGKLTEATGSFRTFLGKIYDESPKEDK